MMPTGGIHRVLLVCCFALVAVSLGMAQVKEWNQIQSPPLPAFKPQEPIRVRLPNGMVIFLQEDHELPLITAFAEIRVGSIYAPANKAGLASDYGDDCR